MASLPRDKLVDIFQMLYSCSGCDYISYFSGLGKPAFFTVFFQYASFIMGGLLSDVTNKRRDIGFLAFTRLIGTLYFKKHYSAIVSLTGMETPQQLFDSKPCTNSNEQYRLWYNEIRTIIGDRITSEEEHMHSHTSMWRHWLRCCWVAHSYVAQFFQGRLV